MFRQVRQFAPLTGVGVGALATQEIPTGGTHYAYILRLLTSGGALITAAQVKADVDLLEILVDGQTFISATGEVLLALTDYYYKSKEGYVAVAGQIVIPLSRDYLNQNVEGDVFAWGTGDINTITLQVSFDSSSITTSSVQIYVEKTDEARVLGQHVRLQRFPQNSSSTGEKSIGDIPKEPGTNVFAFHILYDDNTTTLGSFILTVGANDVLQLTSDLMNALYSKAGRYVYTNASANSIYPVDFHLVNDLRGGLPMSDKEGNTIKDMRLRPTFSVAGPGNYVVYRESVFPGKGR